MCFSRLQCGAVFGDLAGDVRTARSLDIDYQHSMLALFDRSRPSQAYLHTADDAASGVDIVIKTVRTFPNLMHNVTVEMKEGRMLRHVSSC